MKAPVTKAHTSCAPNSVTWVRMAAEGRADAATEMATM
jgi:hypothetical protein